MYRYLLLFIFFSSCAGSNKVEKSNSGKKLLPTSLQVVYPKDDKFFQSQLKEHLQAKGFEIITMAEGFGLVRSDMTNLFQQEGITQNNILDKITSSHTFQVLWVRVFSNNNTDMTDCKIDSIYWKTFYAMSGDTGRLYQKYYPANDVQRNCGETLKKFADTIYAIQ